jgi:Fe-S oxidoreductase
LKTRRLTSLLHLGVVWGFTLYFLVNAFDVILGFAESFEGTLESFGLLFDLYRVSADVLSIVVIGGVIYFFFRRYTLPSKKDLLFNDNILLHPKAKAGQVNRDSVIVVVFIAIHVGARLLGEAVTIAQHDADIWMPFATLLSPLFEGMSAGLQDLFRHGFWWTALGSILLFLPYFPYTKHAHLFMAPLNYLTRPERTSLGELDWMDFEDEEKEQFGANLLEHLPKTSIFDAFACIMCNRCQDVCPATLTGKELSPSALEINKRFLLKDIMVTGVGDDDTPLSEEPLMGSIISESAVWACTTCAACVDICPVGNEPMLDIMEIRRDAVLTQGEVSTELQTAFNGMERQSNPWQIGESRLAWTRDLDFGVPTVESNPDFDLLYWVGCAAAFDPRAQKVARAFVTVLHAAGVNFAILGEQESCTGDTARRAGNEYLYVEMASANIETLNAVNPPRIVATCPHCFHTLGKEYHQLGGDYDVIHHTEFIAELIAAGKLPLSAAPEHQDGVTFHDPCYLARHNDVVDEPRKVLERLSVPVTEMPRSGKNAFCCGAGGAQFWKEEEEGTHSVSVTRYQEAQATGMECLAVGCPFCMQMFDSAKSEVTGDPEVKDIAELIAERL